jgi:hypothetical protein
VSGWVDAEALVLSPPSWIVVVVDDLTQMKPRRLVVDEQLTTQCFGIRWSHDSQSLGRAMRSSSAVMALRCPMAVENFIRPS